MASNQVVLYTRIHKTTADRLDEIADTTGMTKAALVDFLLRRQLGFTELSTADIVDREIERYGQEAE